MSVTTASSRMMRPDFPAQPRQHDWRKALGGHGFLWFALCVYVWGAWVLGPDFVTNTLGRELAPAGYVRVVHAWKSSPPASPY